MFLKLHRAPQANEAPHLVLINTDAVNYFYASVGGQVGSSVLHLLGSSKLEALVDAPAALHVNLPDAHVLSAYDQRQDNVWDGRTVWVSQTNIRTLTPVSDRVLITFTDDSELWVYDNVACHSMLKDMGIDHP
jgi:hypothetical protein